VVAYFNKVAGALASQGGSGRSGSQKGDLHRFSSFLKIALATIHTDNARNTMEMGDLTRNSASPPEAEKALSIISSSFGDRMNPMTNGSRDICSRLRT